MRARFFAFLGFGLRRVCVAMEVDPLLFRRFFGVLASVTILRNRQWWKIPLTRLAGAPGGWSGRDHPSIHHLVEEMIDGRRSRETPVEPAGNCAVRSAELRRWRPSALGPALFPPAPAELPSPRWRQPPSLLVRLLRMFFMRLHEIENDSKSADGRTEVTARARAPHRPRRQNGGQTASTTSYLNPARRAGELQTLRKSVSRVA